ncbi:MAG: hypothetical protein ABFD51_04790 [Anaerolineaceae bacterium]
MKTQNNPIFISTPFEVRIPNKTTQQAVEDARTRHNLKSFDTFDNLLKDM